MKPSSVKAKTVVIIEDQTAIRELVSEMLQAKGKFRVIGASADGAAGTVSSIVVPREAMGFGDVKLMLTLGAFLGWHGALFSIAAGSVVLHDVPKATTVAGVPAKVIGKAGCSQPALTMDQISLPE